MGSMSASDAAPLPRLGEVFFDVRGNSRSMRLSWYADTGVAVFSIWQGGMCTGTFRLAIADLPRMVDTLQRGPGGQRAEWDDAEAAGQQAFAEPMDATAQVQMEPLLAQGRPDYPDGPADPLSRPPDPLSRPPDPLTDAPDYFTRPGSRRTAASREQQTGPADYLNGPADSLTRPPDPLAAPPDYLTRPPDSLTRPPDPLDPLAAPPDYLTDPPERRPGPSHRAPPPDSFTRPPDPLAEPPDYLAGPTEHLTGPPSHRNTPPDYPRSQDYLSGPTDYPAGPPRRRTEYQADLPSPGQADPADYGSASYAGSRQGTRNPGGPIDYQDEAPAAHYAPRTGVPGHGDADEPSAADYPAHYGTADTDETEDGPPPDSFPYGRPPRSR